MHDIFQVCTHSFKSTKDGTRITIYTYGHPDELTVYEFKVLFHLDIDNTDIDIALI